MSLLVEQNHAYRNVPKDADISTAFEGVEVLYMNEKIVFGDTGISSRADKVEELEGKHKKLWKYFVEYKQGMTSPILLEVFRDPDTQKLEFVTMQDDETVICGWVEIDGIVIMPPSPKIAAIIKLPGKPVEYGDIVTLGRDVRDFIHTWCDVSPDYEKIAANYPFHTWVHDRYHTVPYLRVQADWGSGKTRFLDTVGGLSYRATNIAGATAAVIYRLQNQWKGTLVWDEADLLDSSTRSEMVKILNLGFEKGHYIPRCGQDNFNNIEAFDPFGPKILGSRNAFTDNAFESRCFTEVLQETTREDIPRSLNDEFHRTQEELRSKLLMFRLKHWSQLDSDAPNKVDLRGIDKRLKQIASPFAVTMEMVTPDYMEEFRTNYLPKYQQGLRANRADTEEGMVASVILELREKGDSDRITYIDIQRGMSTSYAGIPLKPQTIGYIVRGLGIKTPLRMTVGGKYTMYFRKDDPALDRIAEKYGQKDEEATQ